MSRPTINYDLVISEYQHITSEISNYYKSRSQLFTITISSIGAIIGFSHTIGDFFSVMGIYIVFIFGSILTYAFTFETISRRAYIKVFLENKFNDLNYYSAIKYDNLEIKILYKLRKKLRIPIEIFPHEYTSIFIFLLIVIIIFSIFTYDKTSDNNIFYTILIGTIISAIPIIQIHYIESEYRYEKFIENWERIERKINKQNNITNLNKSK